MTIAYRSGDYSAATPVGNAVLSAPLPGVNIDYVLKQKFQQLLASYAPLALNTPHPDYPDFILVSEGEKMDVRGLTCEWERTYAKVPATHSLPTSIAYNFIGYVGASAFVTRARRVKTVPARIQHDYFLLNGSPYSTIEDIPTFQEQKYFAAVEAGVALNLEGDQIGYQSDISYPVPGSDSGFPAPGGGNILNAAYADYPTRDVYQGWIDANAAILASPPVDVSTLKELVARASDLDLWMGNIIVRRTLYILPQ